MNDYAVETHRALAGPLRQEWDALWQAHGKECLASSPGWFEAALEMEDRENSKIVTLRRSGRLVAVVPLMNTRRFGVSVHVLPAEEFITVYEPLVDASEPDIAAALVHALSMLGLVVLSGLRQETVKMLGGTLHAAFIETDVEYPLDRSAGKYGAMTRAKKTRHVLNRIKRAKHISLEIENATYEMLELCYSIDQKSTKDKRGKGVFWRDDARAFYARLAKLNPSRVIISLMRIEDVPAAYMLYFRDGKELIGSQKAYLSGYDYFNPGFASFLLHLDRLGSDMQINLGRGEDRFKNDFSKLRRSIYTTAISENSFMRAWFVNLTAARMRAYRAIVRYPKLYANYKHLQRAFL